MLLGDAGKHDNNFYFGHSIKQKEYALFKANLLSEITGKETTIKYLVHHLNGKSYESINVYPKITDEIKELVGCMYQGNRKRVTPEILNYLTLEGIALWYMDDGSMSEAYDKKGWRHGIKTTLMKQLAGMLLPGRLMVCR